MSFTNIRRRKLKTCNCYGFYENLPVMDFHFIFKKNMLTLLVEVPMAYWCLISIEIVSIFLFKRHPIPFAVCQHQVIINCAFCPVRTPPGLATCLVRKMIRIVGVIDIVCPSLLMTLVFWTWVIYKFTGRWEKAKCPVRTPFWI